MASGIIANPFQILMTQLQRLQDFSSQQLCGDLQVEIPTYRLQECRHIAEKLPLFSKKLPALPELHSHGYAPGRSEADENYEVIINNYWRPSLSVIGFEGLPPLSKAGNVIYKELKLRCSLRLPPTLTATKAAEIVSRILNESRPETYNAKIELTIGEGGNGFDAPKLPETIESKFKEAHAAVFPGQPMFIGCGGSIPFMEVFSQNFPGTNFLLTGCGFLDSNAHSANENLDLDYCRKLTTVVGLLLSKL